MIVARLGLSPARSLRGRTTVGIVVRRNFDAPPVGIDQNDVGGKKTIGLGSQSDTLLGGRAADVARRSGHGVRELGLIDVEENRGIADSDITWDGDSLVHNGCSL